MEYSSQAVDRRVGWQERMSGGKKKVLKKFLISGVESQDPNNIRFISFPPFQNTNLVYPSFCFADMQLFIEVFSLSYNIQIFACFCVAMLSFLS